MTRTPAPLRADQCTRVLEYVTANPWKTAPEIGAALGLGEVAKARLDELKRSGVVVRAPSATTSCRPWRWATAEYARPTDYDAHEMPTFTGYPQACSRCGLTWHVGIRTMGSCRPMGSPDGSTPVGSSKVERTDLQEMVVMVSLNHLRELVDTLGAYLAKTISEHWTPQRQAVRDAHRKMVAELEEIG